MSTRAHPSLEDLNTWGRQKFERASRERLPREDGSQRASREDFANGYLSALVDLRALSQFTPDARARLFANAGARA